jgi:anti-anti-sigma factor
MNFQFTFSSIDKDALVISVAGDLDLSTAPELQRQTETAIDGYRSVVLDLSKCPFIDSTGLRIVLDLHRKLADDRQVVTMGVIASPDIRQFFSLTAIDQSVPVFLSCEQAMESVHSSLTSGDSSPLMRSHPAGSAEG